MTTRHAAPGGEFAAEKFASSAEFERGLLGSMVARRCTVLEDPKDKELIWSIHFFSHQGGGLKTLAAALLENYPEHFGTPAMVKLGKRSGNYNAEQVRSVRSELPEFERQHFVLRGETLADVDRDARRSRRYAREAAHARAMLKASDSMRDYGSSDAECAEIMRREMAIVEREEIDLKASAGKNPTSYAVTDFISVCNQTAADDLEETLKRLCLDPACEPRNFQPWYFAGLVDALCAFFKQCAEDRAEGLVTTEIGREVIETLEYTAYSRKMTLIEGEARTGKTFSARTWCELHPGHARFVEVPTGNDETSFFRALARGLGIGNFAQYKAIEIRERVESVLLTGDLLVVLDEAWRLWPQQTEQRFGFPKRITWVMHMANQGVPICLLSTPQFLVTLKSKEEKGGWNSAQFQGRLAEYKQLPAELSKKDLVNVAAALLPEGDDQTLRAIADYARSSARYLAAIETISTRARYLASRAGRDSAEAEDVRRAMEESVIPSDSKLVRVLEAKRPTGRRRSMAAPAAAAVLPEISSDESPVQRRAGDRDLRPPIAGRRAETLTSLSLEPAE
jgi:AAA domain